MVVVYCRHCGAEIPEGSKFCLVCGKDLTADGGSELVTQPTAREKRGGWGVLKIVGAVVLVFIVVLALTLTSYYLLEGRGPRSLWTATTVTVWVDVTDNQDGSSMENYDVDVRFYDSSGISYGKRETKTNDNGVAMISVDISEEGDYSVDAMAFSSFWGIPVTSNLVQFTVEDGLYDENVYLELEV